MLRPHFRVFFCPRPFFTTPAGYSFFVPLMGATLRLLTTLTQPPPDVQDRAGVILDPERHGDHFRYTRQGP